MNNTRASLHTSLTTDRISSSEGTESHRYPEFLRLPKVGERCPVSGLCRSSLNALILGPNPPVKSVVLRKRCAVRGVRLIVTSSLLGYLYSHIEPSNKEAAGE